MLLIPNIFPTNLVEACEGEAGSPIPPVAAFGDWL